MQGADYDSKGFAKKLLTAAGIEATEKNDLMMQNRMLDDGLFYINGKGWIEKEKYFLEKITAKDFLALQDYNGVTVKAVYEDGKGELSFTCTMEGKTENLFVVKASNRQRKRQWPTSSGELNSSPIYTMPNSKEKTMVPYKPEKFPNGKWKITAFEKNGTEEYGPYKIRTDAIRNVNGYKAKKDENKILIGWEEIKNDKGKKEVFEDGHLLIHGGTGKIIKNLSEVEKLDARKGTNDYRGTTLGCIRICNLDVYLIVHVLSNYLNIKGNIELEVK